MDDLRVNRCIKSQAQDYEIDGKMSFISKLHPNVKIPAIDFPSLKWIGVNEIVYSEKYINKVAFQICEVKIPGCIEDTSGDKFEDWIYNFASSSQGQIFTDYPFQYESFPVKFEDPFSEYVLTPNSQNQGYEVKKLRQQKNPD